jgi:Glycosyl hydrolases family 16
MISTSSRHGRHARVAPGPAVGAPEAEEGVAGPRRRRRTWLLLIVAPVSAVLVAVGLVGMHVVTRPIHVTADAGRPPAQPHAGKSAVSALSVAPSCCFYSGIGSVPPSHSAFPRHHAAKKARANASASPSRSGAAGSTGSDGSSPPGSGAGWRLTYSTDFPGNSLPSGWLAYNGEPGGDPDGNWEPSNVSVSGGAMHLMATSSAQGGVQFYGNPQTYGMYLVRMKGDYEPGLSINNLAILWPSQQGVWPPEVDFFQDAGGSRQNFSASLHVGPDGNGGCCVMASPTQDSSGTAWHTYGVQWTPNAMTYTIDGRVWASVSRSSLSSPAQWPTIPMNLTLQSQNQDSAQPSGTIETMTVAWVAEYAMNG